MSLALRIISSIDQVDSFAWDLCAGSHPFVRHAFLKALETVGTKRGVLPRHVLLYEREKLVACAPGMLKSGTVREYGPEARWLKDGMAAGCFAWPKFQLGVPLQPTLGPRILVHPDGNADLIQKSTLRALKQLAPHLGAGQSFNVMHVDAETALALKQSGALLSSESHSMWFNAGYDDLRAYLATLPEHKRSRFLKERRCAEAQGLNFSVLRGGEISDLIITDYYEGHRRVCARHGHEPWLPQAAYREIVKSMGGACLFGYFDDASRLVAGILCLYACEEGVLYLLQWSEMAKINGIALDLICLRPIDFAIAHGIPKVDSGLAALHKKLRGWQTCNVFHAHWFNDSRLESLAEFYTRA